jgi:sugar phosphate isomerase/epimerase
VDSRSFFHWPDPARRAESIAEAERVVALAHDLGAPGVRVFGDTVQPGADLESTGRWIADAMQALREKARPAGVELWLESHGDFTRSPELKEILVAVNLPTVALLWDAHHTVVAGGEAPAETWRALGPYVRHTHLKDSRPEKDGVRYVLTGEGTVPVRETVRVLAEGGYKGYYCFEWEKKWHPEIEEPEVAFPQYARTVAGYLTAAGIP